MNSLMRICSVIVSIGAWLMILVSDEMFEDRARAGRLVYGCLIPVAFIYLHWRWNRFLMPGSGVSPGVKNYVAEHYEKHFAPRFYHWVGGLGYLGLLLYLFAFFDRGTGPESAQSDFLFIAVLLVGAGALGEVRGAISGLSEYVNNFSIEPDAAPETPPAAGVLDTPETLNPECEREIPADSGGR